MDGRHSEVSVPLYPRWGLFTVESVNGVTTISLHHKPIWSSTMETDGIEEPDINSNCVSAAPAPSHFPVSPQQEPSSDSRGGCSFCQRREQNLEELLNFERELVRRSFHLTQQYPQQASQQGVAFTEAHNQVLQPKAAKRLNQILQPESSKKLKQDNLKSPDSQLTESSGWCSLCQIDCSGKKDLEAHILGRRHRQMLKKLKEGEIIGNPEKNEKQVNEGDVPQKKRKRSSHTNEQNRQTLKKLKEGEIIGNPEKNEKQVNKGDVPQKKRKRSSHTNEQTVKCNTCDKVFITQNSFELHIAGKKHAKKLKIMESSKVSLRVKDDSKKCATADENKLISTESGLLAEDDAKKIAECKHAGKAKDDGNSSARSDKFDVKANTVLKDQEQKKKEFMSPNKQKQSKKLNTSNKKACKTCNVVVFGEVNFEKHLSGRKHARMLKILEVYKSYLESKGNGKDCGKVNSKYSGGPDLGLLSNNNADKMIEDKIISEFKDDRNLRANSDKDLQRDDGDNIDVSNGEDNKLEVEVRNDNDDQQEIAEIKEIDGDDLQRDDGDNVDVSDGEDNKLEVELRNDIDVQKEIAEIKEIDGEDIDVPNGEDNNLEVEVRDDKEITKTDNFDGKKYNKMDIKEIAISDLKRSEASSDGSLVKDDMCKIAGDQIILEVKDNGGLEAHGVDNGL